MLSNAELCILSKGLKFIPKPKQLDKDDIKAGLVQLRKQIINQYEKQRPSRTDGHTPSHINPSTSIDTLSQNTGTLSGWSIPTPTYNPFDTIKKFKKKNSVASKPESNNSCLNLVLNKLDLEINKRATQTNGDNITKAERQAIAAIKNNANIVINKADKGSTIVVVNKSDYIEEGLKHLDAPTVYRKLTADATTNVYTWVTKFLQRLRFLKWIPLEFIDFCTPPKDYRTSQLYFLKKIHKTPMGIRPIVSSVNSVTENISSFVDVWLQPIVQQLPSYLKDSTEFIKLITSITIPADSILVSIDVSSLYTNIPHKDGIEATINALRQDTDPNPLRPPIEILEEMLNIVLRNNVIEFNGEFFLQLQGTAMGTKMAPAYANLFMGSLEPRLQNLGHNHIELWKRFIDDIFVIWTGTHEGLDKFMTDLNTVHPTIKFTHEKSDTELTFLDVTVYKGPQFLETGRLDVRTHIKPTNKQLYIHKSSYHPESAKTAIPKGETQRYLRSNTRAETFTKITKKLKQKLIERGYKPSELTKIINSYPFEMREELLTNSKGNSRKKPLVLPIKFSPFCKDVRDIINTYWPDIEQDAKYSQTNQW